MTWYSHWVAITPGNNVGQQILSRYPLQSTGARYLSFGRSVTQVTVNYWRPYNQLLLHAPFFRVERHGGRRSCRR